MEIQTRSDGKRIYPIQLKREILDLLQSGKSAAELSREYQIPIQNIQKWNRRFQQAQQFSYQGAKPEEMISKTEHLKVVQEFEKQLKQLKKSLAEMTVDRDILKDAVDIASKKKWL